MTALAVAEDGAIDGASADQNNRYGSYADGDPRTVRKGKRG
jgi:hypothetical protein